VNASAWVALIYLFSLAIAVGVAFDLRRLHVEGWALYALVVFLFPFIGIVAWATARNKRKYLADDSDKPPAKKAFPL
jgi:uncharacterized membrane protein YhaH (DUF805 family)